MKEIRFFYVPNAIEHTELPEEEAVHALRVLRLTEGDEIFLMDGEGTFHTARIAATSSKHCFYTIVRSERQQKAWTGRIHLAIAPTKMMERIEWLAEKATEVGMDEFSLIDCKFSERHVVKVPRLEKIVIAAMKQSHKAWKPLVHEMTSLERFIRAHHDGRRYIAHCYDDIPRVNLFEELCKNDLSTDALVLVGPEGDFSIDEVRMAEKAGFISVDLGTSRLRTETAGLAAIMMMQLSKQKI